MSLMEFNVEIDDVDYTIVVNYIECSKPSRRSPHFCDSDLDYYGATHIEYEVTNAEGLDCKDQLTEKQLMKIEQDILDNSSIDYSRDY
jgi:hypothetical protein